MNADDFFDTFVSAAAGNGTFQLTPIQDSGFVPWLFDGMHDAGASTNHLKVERIVSPSGHGEHGLADVSQIVVSRSRNRTPEMAEAPSRRVSASKSETVRPTQQET